MDLSELIDVHRGDRSYADLERDCGGAPSSKRLQQLARSPIKNFPDPPTVKALAKGLRVSQTAVVLASAESLGLDVSTTMPRVVELLSADARQLSEEQAAAIAHLVSTIVKPRVDIARSNIDIEYDGPEPRVKDVLAAREHLRAVAEDGDPEDATEVDEIARRIRERDGGASEE